MKDKLLKIINYYGLNHQLRKFNEEVFELNQAIIQKEYPAIGRKPESIIEFENNHIAEEIADCYVMLEQFRYFYKIDEKDVLKVIQQKIDRQLERINQEENK